MWQMGGWRQVEEVGRQQKSCVFSEPEASWSRWFSPPTLTLLIPNFPQQETDLRLISVWTDIKLDLRLISTHSRMLIERVNKMNSLWEGTFSGKEPAGWPIDTKQVIWEVSAAFCPGVFLEPLGTCVGRAGCVRFHFISLIKANSNLKRTQSTPSVAQTQWTWMTWMSFSMSRCHSEPYLLEKEESRRFCSDPWLANDPYKGL